MRWRVTPCGLASAPGWRTSPFGTKPGAFSFLDPRVQPAARRNRRMISADCLLLPACALSAADHQIIPVHHFGAAAEPEDREDVGGRATLDLGGVLGVVGDEAAADLGAVGAADNDGVAAGENALDEDHSGGQQALAAAQRRDRTGIDRQDALGLE